jgi:two-component system sensor histidine kinase MprB
VTRRVAAAGVLAVCFSALLVGVIAYGLVARSVRSSENRILLNDARHPASTFSARFTYSELAQVTNRHGVVVRETVALAQIGALPALRRGYANLVLDGRHLRVYTAQIRPRARLSVAVSDAPARASLSRLRRGVLIAMIAGAVLASLGLIWITRRALRPVRDTAALADRIVSTGDLTARVPDSPGDDEVAQLARSMNRMLDHLEASDTALRRLVADASHELRSPVTTLRGNLELLAGGALSARDRDEALADTRAEAERLGEMVEELLTLARADTVSPDTPVGLLDLLDDATRGTGASVAELSASLAALAIPGDAVSLRAMIRNLVENADRYAGGAEVTVAADPAWLTIRVADHGPGIPPAERDAVFGRFSRGANASGTPGSGLGLAIVAATAHSHGGRVALADTPGGGATFTVTLPR